MGTPSNDLNISIPGYVVFDGVSTFLGRTFQAGSGIVISNTNGVSGNTSISVSGSTVGSTITGDTGGALSPTSGNWNILGQQAGSLSVMDTIGSSSTLKIEDRTWLTPLVVDPSATIGLRGTFQTIAAALTAATAGQTIFVRPGTYTENLTAKAGVNITAFPGDYLGGSTGATVKIIGKTTINFTDRFSFNNIWLETNSDFIISASGAVPLVTLNNCTINASTTTAFSFAGGTLNINNCLGALGTTGISYFSISNSTTITINGCVLNNSANSLTASTASGGCLVNIWDSNFLSYFTSSSTCQFDLRNSTFGISALNTTALIHGSTGSIATAENCRFFGGTASAISVSASATLSLTNSVVSSSNTNAITGAGAIVYGGVTFNGGSSVTNVTTETYYPLTTKQGGTGLSSAGTSGNVLTSDGTNWTSTAPVLRNTTFTYTNAQLKAATNITVIPAQGAGTVITVVNFMLKMNYGGTNVFTNSQNVFFQYGSSTSSFTIYNLGPAAGFWQAASSQYYFGAAQQNNANGIASYENQVVSVGVGGALTGNAANNNTVTGSISWYVQTI